MSGLCTEPAYLMSTIGGWEAWWRLQVPSAAEWDTRAAACTGCGARRHEGCIAATGLQASEPCPVRVRDAEREKERDEGSEAA